MVVASPRPKRKISRVVKNILHINKQTIELSDPKVDEATTKPTKVTPLRNDQNQVNEVVCVADAEETKTERIVINEEKSYL